MQTPLASPSPTPHSHPVSSPLPTTTTSSPPWSSPPLLPVLASSSLQNGSVMLSSSSLLPVVPASPPSSPPVTTASARSILSSLWQPVLPLSRTSSLSSLTMSRRCRPLLCSPRLHVALVPSSTLSSSLLFAPASSVSPSPLASASCNCRRCC